MVALDTNIFIYVLEGNQEFGPDAAKVLRGVQGKGAYPSWFTLNS